MITLSSTAPWVPLVSSLPLASLELVQPEEHQGVRILGAESQVCFLITCMLCARLLASLAPFLQVCANVTFSVPFRTASPPHPMVDPSPPLHPACSSQKSALLPAVFIYLVCLLSSPTCAPGEQGLSVVLCGVPGTQ